MSLENLGLLRVILGLVFVYIMSTMMFRIYPGVLQLSTTDKTQSEYKLTKFEIQIKDRIESLMRLEKLYQEPSFSRSDLARELEIPESDVSYIVNAGFSKNFSQYINDFRLSEAQEFLETTPYSIKDIAKMSGFNSIASFNRVFKDATGLTPSQFRKKSS